jgi:type I restriction enzyme S subunit
MTGFHESKLSDVLTFQRGFDITKSEQSEGRIPIVSSSGISSYHNTAKVKGPGVVIGRKGTLGTVHFLKEDFWPHDTTLWIKDFKGNDPRFLSYFLPALKLENFDVGAANPTLNRNHIHGIKVFFPRERRLQERIVAILSAYDELMENNRRRIALLEKLAEELYREWFVRLRFPGHEKVKLVKGVPEGWRLMRFADIVEYYIGGGWGEDTQSANFSEGAFVIRGTDIPDIQSGNFDDCPFRFHKPSNLKSRQLQADDFIFEVSGGSKDQLLGRNVHITERLLDFLGAPVMGASFCKQLRFKSNEVNPLFMRYFMKLYYECDLVGIYQVQSTGISNYQFESFLKYQTILIPPTDLLTSFAKHVEPMIKLRDEISVANISLRQTRDLLLPRLISGKLSVKELDIQFPPGMAEVTPPGS